MIDPKLEAALQEIVDTLAAVTVKVESRVYGTGSYITRPLRERIAAASVLAQAALASVASTPPAQPVLAPVVREPLTAEAIWRLYESPEAHVDSERPIEVENGHTGEMETQWEPTSHFAPLRFARLIERAHGIHPTEGERSHD